LNSFRKRKKGEGKIMKATLVRALIVLSAVALLATPFKAKAVTYTDATGENNGGIAQSGGILDIASVEVNNNANDLIFKINLVGDIQATDWGNYMVAIDSVPGGDTTGNAWTRPISMPSGMDYWLGSWVNSGGGLQLWNYTGSWNGPTPQTSPTIQQFAVTLTVPLASLGLSVGNTFNFDVYTSGSGSGDSAVDALANPSQTIASWGGPYSSTQTDSYTVVPEPSTTVLVGLSGLLLVGLRKIRR
jgi:hypothetical protein